MGTSDSQFINRFSAILGSMTVIVIGLVFLARDIAAATPLTDEQAAGVPAPAPPSPAPSPAGTAQPAPAVSDGEGVYQQVCSVCHGLGIAGAPKMGDASAWGPRIAQGKPTLYDHALHGFTGKTGVMAPKAGRGDLSDASVQAAVDYMTSRSGS